MLNKRTKIYQKCTHKNQYKLENFLRKPPWEGLPRGFFKNQRKLLLSKFREKATSVSVIFQFQFVCDQAQAETLCNTVEIKHILILCVFANFRRFYKPNRILLPQPELTRYPESASLSLILITVLRKYCLLGRRPVRTTEDSRLSSISNIPWMGLITL